MVMQPELTAHFKDRIAMPKRSLLFEYRLYVDYCCMLWARKFLFSADVPEWHTHFRLDSSPQFGRNYLVGELDRIDLGKVSSANIDGLFTSIEISTRLCPLQILGKQATSTPFKARSSLRMLSLECDVDLARKSVRSLLTDMGVESGLWTLPDLSGAGGKCYPHSMPLADGDHMLHHTMMDGEDGFSRDNCLWPHFDQQIHAIAKCFSKQDHCERYCKKNIWENNNIPQHAKRGLASMFSKKCPTYIKTRWHFAFDVLHWVAGRKQLIEYLEPASIHSVVGGGQSDITAAEAKAFRDLGDPNQRARFWACFWCYFTLQEWGFKVQTWMHGCPCHDPDDDKSTGCPFRGRRLIEFACGQRSLFLHELHRLVPDAHQCTADALRALSAIDPNAVAVLRASFDVSKRFMYIRYEQSTAFYEKYPWCITRLLEFILPGSAGNREAKIRDSKMFAGQLLTSFQDGKVSRDTYATKFFENHLGSALKDWAQSPHDQDMDNSLFKEVLSYSLSLLVMQRLESRHHLVGLKMNPSRGNSAATVSAALRRRLNPDCREESFRSNFSSFLQQFHLLVPEEWTSMRELHNLISGHHIELMFKDTTWEDQLIEAETVRRPSTAAYLDLYNHLAAALTEGSFYAVPISVSDSGETTYHLLQLVTLKPSSKRYMERVVSWSKDDWFERVGVYSFGTTKVLPLVDLEDDSSPENAKVPQVPQPLPGTFQRTLGAGTVEAVPADVFFACGFEHIQQFQLVEPRCEFCLDDLQSASDLFDSDTQMTTDLANDPCLLPFGIIRVRFL